MHLRIKLTIENNIYVHFCSFDTLKRLLWHTFNNQNEYLLANFGWVPGKLKISFPSGLINNYLLKFLLST